MKVTKRSKWTRTLRCKGCKSELEIEADDVRQGDFGCGYGDDHDFKFYVHCAVCKEVNFVGALPGHVEELAQSKRRR